MAIWSPLRYLTEFKSYPQRIFECLRSSLQHRNFYARLAFGSLNLSFYFFHVYCLFLLSPHPIYYETCKLYARAELQSLLPNKHQNWLTWASCSISHPGLSQAIWDASLRRVIAPLATMEGHSYINSRTASGLAAKALSTKVADVYPDHLLWAVITDVPYLTGIHLHF